MYIYIYINIYIYIYIFTDIHQCMHTSTHTCMHAYIHAYMHAYMHACIHTSIHPYIHTYIICIPWPVQPGANHSAPRNGPPCPTCYALARCLPCSISWKTSRPNEVVTGAGAAISWGSGSRVHRSPSIFQTLWGYQTSPLSD